MSPLPNPMPPRSHLAKPSQIGVHTIMECDEVLARGCPSLAITDAWLDERLRARDAIGMANFQAEDTAA